MRVLSCEHATQWIPVNDAGLFAGDVGAAALESHEGWDPGALVLATAFQKNWQCPLHCGEQSRLILDLNRSPENPARWSRFSRFLSEAERAKRHEAVFMPFFEGLKNELEGAIAAHGRVEHLSVHSFTRVLGQERRTTDIGLLFDPAREGEVELVRAWAERLRARLPGLRVDENRPYLGTEDGLTRLFRKLYPDTHYCGLELEVCSDLLGGDSAGLMAALVETYPKSI